MQRTFAEFRCALRRGWALFLLRRQSPAAPAPRLQVLVMLGAAWLAGFTGLSWIWAGEQPFFNEYGLNTLAASWIVFAVLVILFARGQRHVPLSRAFADVTSVALISCLTVLILAIGTHLAGIRLEDASQAAMAVAVVAIALYVWQLVAIWRAGRSVFPATVSWPGFKLCAAAMLPMFLVPNTPLIRSYSLPEMRVDVWSWPDAYRSFFPEEETDTADAAPRFDYESLLYRQSAMVEAALGRVAPASGDGAQFYFVGAAPSSYHAVFRREVESARAVFNERFGTQDRSISLISDTETSEQAPLASMTNLTRILEGFGQKMNKDRDVLVLFLTSHGSKEELQVHFPGAHFNPMTSMGIAKALDASGIKNRVIIVSACHSGSMIPDLEGPNTLILTAAHADKTSFGCSNDRDWTYFGDALFNHALRETRSLPEAFERAKVLIAAWESEQGYTPSEPQMSAGEAILGTLNAMPHGPVDSRAAVMD